MAGTTNNIDQIQDTSQEIYTQVEFRSDNQLSETGNFNTQQSDKNHNQRRPIMDNGDNDMVLLKSKFDDKIQLYKFMHENKNPEGKRLSGTARKSLWKEIMDMFNNLKLHNGLISNYVINDPDINWTTFIADERFWNLWDSKEALINQDKEKERGRDRYRTMDKSRNQSRSRSRSRDYNRNNKDREEREQVMRCLGIYWFLSLFTFPPA